MSSEIERRREWARLKIGQAAGLLIPQYGSVEFLTLPETSFAKMASAVRAAECWARAGDDLTDDLALELEQTRRVRKQFEDAEYVADIAEHRERWGHLRVVPGALDALNGRTNPPADLYEIGAAHLAQRRAEGDRGDRRG